MNIANIVKTVNIVNIVNIVNTVNIVKVGKIDKTKFKTKKLPRLHLAHLSCTIFGIFCFKVIERVVENIWHPPPSFSSLLTSPCLLAFQLRAPMTPCSSLRVYSLFSNFVLATRSMNAIIIIWNHPDGANSNNAGLWGGQTVVFASELLTWWNLFLYSSLWRPF